MPDDIRWMQRFDNFQRALRQLDEAVALMKERDLSQLEAQGVIKAFEYNYELAWNVIKDFYSQCPAENHLNLPKKLEMLIVRHGFFRKAVIFQPVRGLE